MSVKESGKLERYDLLDLVVEALKVLGGKAHLVRVAEQIWRENEQVLRDSGDLFFTWQYDMRWAAQRLRDSGRLTLDGRAWVLT